jgi:hypothetical protein
VTPAALGLRTHSGWAALVAVAGDRNSPEVVLRERIEMADDAKARQPYHAAEGLELPEAERVVRRYARSAAGMARRGLGRGLRELRRRGYEARAVGILQAAGRLPSRLADVLASHAFIHTADGEHFRNALADAVADAGLAVTRVPERELLERAVSALRRSPDELTARAAALGKPLGPPWTADQKLATLLAWMLLAESTGSRAGQRP